MGYAVAQPHVQAGLERLAEEARRHFWPGNGQGDLRLSEKCHTEAYHELLLVIRGRRRKNRQAKPIAPV